MIDIFECYLRQNRRLPETGRIRIQFQEVVNTYFNRLPY